MRSQVLALIVVAGCVPSRSAVFGPVDREIEQRLGVTATWHDSADPRVPAAIAELLQRPLDRDSVVRIALATNRRLQAQYDQLGIAASEVAAATVLRPLEVDLETRLSSGGGVRELEVDVTQDILDVLQLPQRRGVARADLDAARARAVAATVALVARVEVAFLDVVAAQQELELRSVAFDAASASAEIAERQHAAGNISDLALIRERDQREQARIELGRAQVDVEARREPLNEVLGLSGAQTRWTIASRLAELPAELPALDALERDAVGAQPRARGAARRGRPPPRAGSGIARVRAWLPALGVGVSAARDDDGAWDAGPALSLGLPLFNQQQGPRARASAELRRARNEAVATGGRGAGARARGPPARARRVRRGAAPARRRAAAAAAPRRRDPPAVQRDERVDVRAADRAPRARRRGPPVHRRGAPVLARVCRCARPRPRRDVDRGSGAAARRAHPRAPHGRTLR